MKLPALTRFLCAAFFGATLAVSQAQAADPPAAPPELRTLLQQALFEEEATRDLEKAATGYETLLTRWTEQRRYAASALFRLAEVRRKQNRKDDAIKLYQRLLSEFPDQDPETRLSRENLTALGVKPASSAAAAPEAPVDPEEQKELGRLTVLAENSPAHVLDPVPWPEAGSPTDTLGVLSNAARKGWRRVAAWLLDHDADPNQNFRGTPLYHAVQRGDLAMCVLLFSRGAKPESALGALTEAISQNQNDIAELLVSKGVNVNRGTTIHLDTANKSVWMDATPLITAIARGNRPWVDRLLSLKADVNASSESRFSALHAACWKGDTAIVQRLLDSGADPNIGDDLHEFTVSAIRTPRTDAAGWTPLHYAAAKPAIVTALLKKGAKPGAADSHGLTPLHCACFARQPESARLLLEAGANVHSQATVRKTPNAPADFSGVTPLHAAVAANAPDALIEILLRAGAKGDARDTNGSTPFYAAAVSRRLPAVELMLKAGVPADLPREDGTTELGGAFAIEAATAPPVPGQKDAQPSVAPLIDLLLKHGADPERLQKNGAPLFYIATPARRNAFMQGRIYPKLAGEKAIHLAFTESGRLERLARQEKDGATPPALADALVAFDESEKLQFSALSLWRKKTGGIMERFAVETTGAGPLPDLQWGDVIELSVEDSKVPDNPMLPFRQRLVRKVTVQMGNMKQEMTLRGRLRVYDPSQAEAPLVSIRELVDLLGGWHPDFYGSEMTVSHSAAKGGGVMSWPLHTSAAALPEEGDTIVVKEGDKEKALASRRMTVYFAVPGRMCAWLLEGADKNPSLLQFLAEVYAPWSTGDLLRGRADSSTAEEAAAEISRLKPAELAALVSAEGTRALNRPLVTWPDWAGLRVRRLKDGGAEEVIGVNLSAWMVSPSADALPEGAQMILQRGDIVELPVLKDHPPGPWPGLEAGAVRLFQEALKTRVTLVEHTGRFREATASWIPPRWVDTSAGLLPVPDGVAAGGKVQSLRVWNFVHSAAPGFEIESVSRNGKIAASASQSQAPGDYFVRPGDILQLKKKPPSTLAPGFGTTSVGGNVPPRPRRNVVLPQSTLPPQPVPAKP